jgi:hypothetical protein
MKHHPDSSRTAQRRRITTQPNDGLRFPRGTANMDGDSQTIE